jgi:3-hydroxyisobutyrate dehydrogenase-like beta-hydroxyacid dehydrogenase/CBS domain-containing protein
MVKKIGIIGVGIQGSAVAKMLLENGVEVHAFDTCTAQLLCAKKYGAHTHPSISSLLHSSSIILLILPPGPLPLHVLWDEEGQRELRSDHIVVQMGTASLTITQQIDSLAQEHSFSCCEAIIGGPIASILDGTCPIFFGGTHKQKEEITPILSNIGVITNVGNMGQGTLLNIAILTHVYSLIHGYSLASAMIQRAEISPDIWHELINNGVGGHPAELLTKFWWPAHLENRSYGLIGPAQVKNETAIAEIEIILEQAQQNQLDTGLLMAMKRIHAQAHALSAERDWSSIFDQLAPETIQTKRHKHTSISPTRNSSTPKSSSILQDLISKKAPILYPHSTIQEASKAFQKSKISDLAVLNPINNDFLGVISQGEILRAQISNTEKNIHPSQNMHDIESLFLNELRSMNQKIISPFILRTPYSISPKQDIFSLAILMTEKKIQHLPVVNGKEYLGHISRHDLLAKLMNG